jgi:hypothetical protein
MNENTIKSITRKPGLSPKRNNHGRNRCVRTPEINRFFPTYRQKMVHETVIIDELSQSIAYLYIGIGLKIAISINHPSV